MGLLSHLCLRPKPNRSKFFFSLDTPDYADPVSLETNVLYIYIYTYKM